MQAGLASVTDGAVAQTMEPTTSQNGNFVPPDPQDLAKLFPQLEILGLLGWGGMGAVYKARQPSLDRLVAVKILPPEVGADPAFAERFTREAQALAKLSHQNIVSVFDFGQADGMWYFVMEYVDGANLRQLIQSGGINPESAMAIVPQICEALQFAHSEGVVHRDIKPENILLDKQGRVKVADFGLAKLLGTAPTDHSLTRTHQVMGTPHYMAPEQLQASRAVDHRADIYSLGVVFYEMLTGELPIGRFDLPSKKVQVDVRLDEVVLHALESEPQRRYQRASDIKTDVESVSKSFAPSDPQTSATGGLKSSVPQPPFAQTETDEHSAIRAELEGPSLIMMVLGLLMAAGHLTTIVICLQSRFDDDTAWIGLPGLIVGLTMFCGGLSLRKLWSSGWAYLGAIAALIPAGPGWLITAFVGIWIFDVLGRPHIRDAFTQRSYRVTRSDQPRSSRKAVIGALWAPFFFVTLLCMAITTTERSIPAPIEQVSAEVSIDSADTAAREQTRERATFRKFAWWQWVLIVGVVPLGLTAPFGTTAMGLLSISDIRHSRGRLIGMPLAVADTLCFPLLLLDCLIVAAVLLIAYYAFVDQLGTQDMFDPMVLAPILLITLLLCAIVDFLLVRATWRGATASISDTQ
jgi:serine/threonine protein kinase